ncbi:MAG: hypothetical protein IIY33_01325, partial [Erysipelotrichaceae bacterium]|nr:hypothetical protein [Erysipelotrichaceae bacterium]
AGETVNIHFDIADGYALDQNKPFIMDDVFMNHYYDSVALDGDILKVLTMTKNGYDYDLNPEVITVTEDSISWVMGAANFMFTPNIIFVGYNTQTEQDISDILDTNGEDEYSAPGIVFYNESSEAKSYTVDFTKPGSTPASGELHSAVLMAKRGLLKSSAVEPVEGEDGIGSYVLYVTTGKVGEAGTKLEPIHVANLKSLNVTVEAGEFVTYSVVPDEGNETEINDIQFEVKDEEENVVQTGYISTDDTSKHLVYEEAEITQTPVKFVGSSLNLDGIISMNFYIKVPEEYEGAYAVLTDETGNVMNVDLSTVPYSTANGYKITYPNIVAKRMMMKISLTVYDREGNVLPMERKGSLLPNGTVSNSVVEYVSSMMNNSRPYSKELGQAILNYGQCAQEYFGYETDKPMPNPLGYLSEEMASVEINHAYDQVIPTWDQYVGTSLDLEGAITSYLYLKVPVTAVLVNEDGSETALPVVLKSAGYRVEVRDIAAKKLHEMYRIKVTYNGSSYEYKLGALSYANKSLIPKPEARKSELGKALYLYNKYARLYFNY